MKTTVSTNSPGRIAETLCRPPRGLAALFGMAAGMLGSFAVTRVMRTLLSEVEPTDPLVLGTVSVLLLLIATIASLVPARMVPRARLQLFDCFEASDIGT